MIKTIFLKSKTDCQLANQFRLALTWTTLLLTIGFSMSSLPTLIATTMAKTNLILLQMNTNMMYLIITELVRLYYEEFGMRKSKLLDKMLEYLMAYDNESDSN